MRTAISYGIGTGVALILWILLEYLLGLHSAYLFFGQYPGLLGVWILLAGILLGIRRHKQHAEPPFAAPDVLMTGLYITIFATLVSAVFLMFYYESIHPELLEAFKEQHVSDLMEAGVPEEEAQLRVSAPDFRYSRLIMLGYHIGGMAIAGLLFSLISTLIFRDSRP